MTSAAAVYTRVEGAFQTNSETALNTRVRYLIFHFHRPTRYQGLCAPLRDDHPRGEKRPHGPVGAGEKTEPCGHRNTHTG